MNRIGTAAAVVVIGALCQAGPSGQQPAGDPTIAAIKAEGLGRSEAPRLFHTLTDVIGPRLRRAATRDEKIPRRPRGSQ